MIKLKFKIVLDEKQIQEVVQDNMYNFVKYGLETYLRPVTPVVTGRLRDSEEAIIVNTSKNTARVSIMAEDYFKYVQARRGFANSFIDYLGGASDVTEEDYYDIEEDFS